MEAAKAVELLGSTAPVAEDWCAEHLVPESACVECNPDLFARPAQHGFCKLHGVAEFVIDHPELAQTKKAPHLPKYDTVAAIAARERPENNSGNTLHTHLVQFASAASATKTGVDVDLAFERPMIEAISASGELACDAHGRANSAGAPGNDRNRRGAVDDHARLGATADHDHGERARARPGQLCRRSEGADRR